MISKASYISLVRGKARLAALCQVILGAGFPVVVQLSSILLPSKYSFTEGLIETVGAVISLPRINIPILAGMYVSSV